MSDFENIWKIIQNFLDIQFNLYGFTLTWGNILLYSLFGTLLVGVLVHLFKSHE